MGKLAFVFSGQGAQYPGMGRRFYEEVPEARELFDRAEALRPGTLEQCFSGDEAALRRTENAQPCLYLAGLAAALALREAGITARGAAGFSLGELPALAFAGALSPMEGFRLACRRGELMQKAAQERPASMAAVLRLDWERVAALCAGRGDVFPANDNCPGQAAVSGTPEGLAALKAEAAALGGKLLPLRVGGGFHAPFMDGAARRFEEELAGAALGTPAMPVYSNVTAQPHGGDLREALARQINHPVRWTELIRNMAAAGFDTFVEAGAGDTLTKLIARILPGARAFSADGGEALEIIKERSYA